MPAVTLSDGGSEAQIAVDFGFNCYSFRSHYGSGSVDVLASDPNFPSTDTKPSHSGIPLLFPWPNRIRSGQFEWAGRTWTLPAELAGQDADGNAIHGLCLDRPWRVVEQTENSVTGEFHLSRDAPDRSELWPADFVLRVRYTLRRNLLRADVTVTNPDNQDLPWGFGTHPYFRLPLSSESSTSNCVVCAPAASLWTLENCLPTGEREAVSEEIDLRDGAWYDQLKLDHVYGDLTAERGAVECVIYDETAGLQVTQRFDPVFRELVAFTPPWFNAICLEPYTCVTDAINLEQRGIDSGWRVLPPGEQQTCWFEISAGPVIV